MGMMNQITFYSAAFLYVLKYLTKDE